jgi:hypothetical protein
MRKPRGNTRIGSELKNLQILRALDLGLLVMDPSTGVVCCCRGKGYSQTTPPRPVTHISLQGYIVGRITVDGEMLEYRAHRVIWIACNGPIPSGMEIDHKNHDRADNRISNLRLVDPAQQMQNCNNKGADNCRARLTWDQASQIRKQRASGVKLKEIAGLYGVSVSTICMVVKGHTYREKYNGFFELRELKAS